jgi:hypothetical protein
MKNFRNSVELFPLSWIAQGNGDTNPVKIIKLGREIWPTVSFPES